MVCRALKKINDKLSDVYYNYSPGNNYLFLILAIKRAGFKKNIFYICLLLRIAELKRERLLLYLIVSILQWKGTDVCRSAEPGGQTRKVSWVRKTTKASSTTEVRAQQNF